MVLIVHLNNIIIHSSETYYYAYSPTTTPTYSVPTGYGQRVGYEDKQEAKGEKEKGKGPQQQPIRSKELLRYILYFGFYFCVLCLNLNLSFLLYTFYLGRKQD